jgi:antirestriction protein ArdC
LGGHVRKGEKATHIILFRPLTKTRTTDDGSEVEERIPIMRTFCVFNAEQTAGLEYLWPGRTELAPAVVEERYQHADAVIAATGADIRHGGNQAFFSRSGDYIQMPFRHQFPSVPPYYESLCHEMIHWTEPPHRLNWERASEGYAAGELVAEIGGCFMASELGLPTGESLANHAAYLQGWLTAMENDPKYIFKASAQASKAVDYLLSFSRKPEPEEVAA